MATVAPGRTPPLWSTTVPTILPDSVCASAEAGSRNAVKAPMHSAKRHLSVHISDILHDENKLVFRFG
jgi:hypothetical protein